MAGPGSKLVSEVVLTVGRRRSGEREKTRLMMLVTSRGYTRAGLAMVHRHMPCARGVSEVQTGHDGASRTWGWLGIGLDWRWRLAGGRGVVEARIERSSSGSGGDGEGREGGRRREVKSREGEQVVDSVEEE